MDLSIIIVEYMNLAILEQAVLSCLTLSPDLITEIIIVSNSSYPQQEQAELRERFPEVNFIFNQDNLGFAKGVNQGIAAASGQYIMFLNPDALLLEGLVQAVNFMRQNPKVAVVGPMIVDNSGDIQDSCRQFMTPSILLIRTLRRLVKMNAGPVLEKRDYHEEQKVDWISGAALLARKTAVDNAGPLDERYFMYAEDMDWCRNFKRHGWEVLYQPNWKVEHNAARSSTSHFSLTNKKMWVHMSSLRKYYFKWFYIDCLDGLYNSRKLILSYIHVKKGAVSSKAKRAMVGTSILAGILLPVWTNIAGRLW
jgi:N-acetylglucosaminyl-diphospho-decaprenol L-rhamnosyltransferase